MEVDIVEKLQENLARSAARHHNLCPRQVLGVRMGMLAGNVLGIDLPQTDKRLFVFVECDGCGMGGIAVATGCYVERRSMQVLDYGKLAATFVDTQTGQVVRIKPHPDCRETARQLLPDNPDSWQAQLEAYQALPDEALFVVEPVELAVSLEAILSRPNVRVNCVACGEEILNERQVLVDGKPVCRTCAGESYFTRGKGAAAPGKDARSSIPLLTIIGKSGSGKTRLLERLVRKLSERGYRVAAVKHHSHKGFDIDVPGKDSWRFAQAGSRQVAIASPDKFAAYRKLEREMTLDEIAAEIREVDLILVEGYRNSNKPSIEVLRAANSYELIGSQEQRIALASDLRLEVGAPRFHLDDVEGIAGFIEERYLKNVT